MRRLVLAAALLLSAAPALAAGGPISDVTVSIGPALQEKAAAEYGTDEVDNLAAELEADVENALSRTGRLSPQGGRLELVLVDAVPNRPTAQQLVATPWLTRQSLGRGGAEIEGRHVGADGADTPVAFEWYSKDIRFSKGSATWSDAEHAFDRFAERVARGDY